MSSDAARFSFTRIQIDPIIATVAGVLLLFGLLMMTSASISISEKNFGDPLYYLRRQGIFVVLGAIAVGIILMLPTRLWRWSGYLSLLLAFVLLIVVLIPGVGHTINGSSRWLRLGFMNFQVSEAARMLMLFYLCGYLVRHQAQVQQNIIGFAKPMLFIVAASCLLLMEPDFGAATVLLGMTLGVLFVGGVRFIHFLGLVVAAITAMGAMALSSEYRRARLTAFLDPWQDPFGSGFQLTQSLIAIGRGEWFGVGLGASVQKLFYLPEAHTDFVFAVMAEEFGLLGVVVTIALFFLLVARGFAIARRAIRANLLFQAYLAFGISIWIGLQAFINIGVNMGALPTKGLTLPLMSYGGSSLLTSMVSIGLLLRVYHEVLDSELNLTPKTGKVLARKRVAKKSSAKPRARIAA